MGLSFHLEHPTLHHRVNKGAHAEVTGRGALENLLKFGAIRETHRCAGREDYELLREIARDRGLVSDDELLEFAHILERTSIWQLTHRVDRRPVVKSEGLPAHAEPAHGGHIFGDGAVTIPVATHH